MTRSQPDATREIADRVPPDSRGTLEIGFAIPQQYNASRILFDNPGKGRTDRLALTGPAGNPECVWLGRRVVSLLWRDDLDTAFRHLDLYDRFGCPSAHIQASFRCLILHGNNIDPKAADSLNARIQSCWINPASPAISVPAAAAASPTTNR